jgi:hypothetical protein
MWNSDHEYTNFKRPGQAYANDDERDSETDLEGLSDTNNRLTVPDEGELGETLPWPPVLEHDYHELPTITDSLMSTHSKGEEIVDLLHEHYKGSGQDICEHNDSDNSEGEEIANLLDELYGDSDQDIAEEGVVRDSESDTPEPTSTNRIAPTTCTRPIRAAANARSERLRKDGFCTMYRNGRYLFDDGSSDLVSEDEEDEQDEDDQVDEDKEYEEEDGEDEEYED